MGRRGKREEGDKPRVLGWPTFLAEYAIVSDVVEERCRAIYECKKKKTTKKEKKDQKKKRGRRRRWGGSC